MACNCCQPEPKCRNSLRVTEVGDLQYIEGLDENGCKKFETVQSLIADFHFGGIGGVGGQTIEEALNTPGIPQYSLQGVHLGNWYPR